MATSVRDWPRSQRRNLLKGPQATVELDSTPRTVITVPRAALMAFSTVAAELLQDAEYTNLLLPVGMAAPAALRYLIEWIPRACEAADFMPIKRKEDFGHTVRIYHAALSLGVTEALVTIGGWLNLCVGAFERAPWPWPQTLDVLTLLPKDCALVARLIEKAALARRRGVVDPVFQNHLAAFLRRCPELAARFAAEDDPDVCRARSGGGGLNGVDDDDRTESDHDQPPNTRSSSTDDSRKRRGRRGGRNRGRSSQGSGGSCSMQPVTNEQVLSEEQIDYLMCRSR